MVDRTIAPTFVKTEEIEIKEAETLEINGIPVHLIRAGVQPVLKIEFIFSAGKAYEKLPGAAYFTANMLQEGTRSYDNKTIAHKLDDYGAHLEASSTLDYSTISLYTLSKHFEKLLPMLIEIISEPEFPEEQLALLKEIEQQQLKIDLLKTKVQSQIKFRGLMYGDHPYGRSLGVEDIPPIKSEYLQEHFKRLYNNCEIFISGQFDEDHLLSLLDKQLPPRKKLDRKSNELLINYKPQKVFEDIDGSVQSSLRLGFPFVARNHEDYIPFQILNHLFGGYFGSRLMKNIREDKGYTYGIFSSVITMKDSSYFTSATDVVKASADDAIEEILKEMRELKNEEVPVDELETVKNHIAGSFQSDITSPFALMDKYKSVYMFNMNYDYYKKYFNALNEITPADLLAIAQKYFDEDNISIVKVG